MGDVAVIEGALARPSEAAGRAPMVLDAAGGPVALAADPWDTGGADLARTAVGGMPLPAERLAGEHLYGGIWRPHFGHFLIETIIRLWAVPALRGQIDGLVFFRRHAGLAPSDPLRKVLALLGVDLPIRFIDRPTRIDALHVPAPGFGPGHLAVGLPAFRAFLRERLQRIPARSGVDRIYLTREGYGLRRGGLFAEDVLRAHLEAEGYVAFAPEAHGIEDQVATYLGARRIVGPDSSALHLLAYAAPEGAETAIILRRPDGGRLLVPQLTGFTGRQPLVVDAISRMMRHDGTRNAAWSQFAEVDFPQVARALRAGGFIGGDSHWPALRPRWRRRAILRYETQLKGRFVTLWQADSLPAPDSD